MLRCGSTDPIKRRKSNHTHALPMAMHICTCSDVASCSCASAHARCGRVCVVSTSIVTKAGLMCCSNEQCPYPVMSRRRARGVSDAAVGVAVNESPSARRRDLVTLVSGHLDTSARRRRRVAREAQTPQRCRRGNDTRVGLRASPPPPRRQTHSQSNTSSRPGTRERHTPESGRRPHRRQYACPKEGWRRLRRAGPLGAETAPERRVARPPPPRPGSRGFRARGIRNRRASPSRGMPSQARPQPRAPSRTRSRGRAAAAAGEPPPPRRLRGGRSQRCSLRLRR
mmetsp:Transcript_36388/g.116540  ORF Transcript_36388/g.116540 Transcript_36388/m.116540 type:complete len:283 (-) Transcript_36388:55-903(-)